MARRNSGFGGGKPVMPNLGALEIRGFDDVGVVGAAHSVVGVHYVHSHGHVAS